MQFHHPLDDILDSSVKTRILRFFCRKGGEWSGRRIAAEVGVNPVTAHRALKALHRETLLDLRKAGSHFLYSLRDGHYIVRRWFRPLFEEEAQVQDHLFRFLRDGLSAKLRSQVVSAAVYGSVVRGEERPTSDIDLLILVESERAKREVHQVLERLWGAVGKEFGNPLALYVNTVREGRKKYRRRLPVFQNILRAHRVIWGKPLREVLHGGKA